MSSRPPSARRRAKRATINQEGGFSAAPIAAAPPPPVPPVVAVEPAPAAEEVPQTPGEVPRYYEQNAVPEYFKDGDADADINDEEEGSDVETVDTTDGSGIVMDLDPAEYERAENPDVECGKPSATAVARAQYIPDDWNPVIDLSKGQPEELPDDMNPAGWNDFTFRPVFEKKTSKAMTYWAFRDKHATAALLYDPTELKYPGDCHVRAVTVKAKNKRKAPTTLVAVTQADLKTKPHLIAHMSELGDHLQRCESATMSAPCSVCTKNTKKRCVACAPKHGKQKGVPLCPGLCFIRYHDMDFHGLCACDVAKPTSWKEPAQARKTENAKKIRLMSGYESL